MSRTYQEVTAENAAHVNDSSKNNLKPKQSEVQEEKPAYSQNLKNVPLGWDGKPIPYWLYKLHGLGIEYKCEICGNASYWGRKAFERHFTEWRHAFGMKCLRIPNTIHFRDVTRIEDAIKCRMIISAQKDYRRQLERYF